MGGNDRSNYTLFMNPPEPGDSDAVQVWVQSCDERLSFMLNNLRSRHGQGAYKAAVILDAEVKRVLGSIDAGLRILPLTLGAEQVIVTTQEDDVWTLG
jgi:hypothetical protein